MDPAIYNHLQAFNLVAGTSMLHEKDMYALLVGRMPEMESELSNAGESECAYKLAAFFAAFTKKLISERNYDRTSECLHLAEILLAGGDHTVKNAIENVYVFSVSQAIAFNQNFADRFPPLLKEELEKQVGAGCV